MRASLLVLSLAVLVASTAAEGNFKTVTGINMGGPGNALSEQNNMKTVEGINLAGLSGAVQDENKKFKTVVGVNLLGLGSNQQAADDGGSQEDDLQGGEDQGTSQWLPDMVNLSEATTVVYVGGISIPLASYQAESGKYLWIENYGGLTEYASIPQYSGLSLIAYTSTGGPGEILEMYPAVSNNQGVYQRTYYNFNPGYNRLPYRGDVPGRHYLMFTMDNQPSNSIIIDVSGNGVVTSQPVLGAAPGGSAA